MYGSNANTPENLQKEQENEVNKWIWNALTDFPFNIFIFKVPRAVQICLMRLCKKCKKEKIQKKSCEIVKSLHTLDSRWFHEISWKWGQSNGWIWHACTYFPPSFQTLIFLISKRNTCVEIDFLMSDDLAKN